jgi:hypothetical protein
MKHNKLEFGRLKPVAIESQQGQRHTLGIIDDASRFMCISAVNENTEVNGMSAARIGREELQRGMKVVSVRTDNGREYVNEQFDAFLDKHDIRWNTPSPTNTRNTALSEGSGAARHSARIFYGCTRILCGCTEL